MLRIGLTEDSEVYFEPAAERSAVERVVAERVVAGLAKSSVRAGWRRSVLVRGACGEFAANLRRFLEPRRLFSGCGLVLRIGLTEDSEVYFGLAVERGEFEAILGAEETFFWLRIGVPHRPH